MKSGDSTWLLETEVSFWMLKCILHRMASLAAAGFLRARCKGDQEALVSVVLTLSDSDDGEIDLAEKLQLELLQPRTECSSVIQLLVKPEVSLPGLDSH
jgi:hypothetical protein